MIWAPGGGGAACDRGSAGGGAACDRGSAGGGAACDRGSAGPLLRRQGMPWEVNIIALFSPAS